MVFGILAALAAFKQSFQQQEDDSKHLIPTMRMALRIWMFRGLGDPKLEETRDAVLESKTMLDGIPVSKWYDWNNVSKEFINLWP
jgi:hypothetical protein